MPSSFAASAAKALEIKKATERQSNKNGQVNGLDWSIMASAWFTADATADLNKDGIVNSIDFSLMNQNWGRTQ